MTSNTKDAPLNTPEAQLKRPWYASKAPAAPPTGQVILMTCTSVAALLLLVVVGKAMGQTVLIPPLAASMALVSGASATPLAQPRHVVGGQLVSALIGYLVLVIGGKGVWSSAIAGGVALGAMLLLRVGHSPATATAVIVALTHPPFWPFIGLLALATVILVAVGYVGHRITKQPYPVYLW